MEGELVFQVKGVLKRRILLLLLSTLALVFSPVYGMSEDSTVLTYSKRLQVLRSSNMELYLSRAYKGNAGAQHNLGLLLLGGPKKKETMF